MNFITEIVAFNDLVMINQLSTGQIALWYALFNINNKCSWIDWFTVSNTTLQLASGLSRDGVYKARNRLKQLGYIKFEQTGKSTASKYKLKSFCIGNGQEIIHPSIQVDIQDNIHPSIQVGIPLTKLNKTKEKKQEPPISPTGEDELLKIPYKQIQEMFNSVCDSYPKCKVLSDARKKAIRARFNAGYRLKDFEILFKMTEESSFLKGSNKRNWSATFDWLIADANMAKVLDGNYSNAATVVTEAKDYSQGQDFLSFAKEAGAIEH